MRILALTLLVLFLVIPSAFAQWTQTSLDSVTVTALYADDAVVLAGTDTNGVYRSTDGGITWTPDNAGLTNGRVVYRFVKAGTDILMGMGGYVYRKAGSAIGWTASSNGMVDTHQVYALNADGSTITMSTAGSFYRSTDNGANWTRQGTDQGISCMISIPSGLLAGTNGGSTIRSTDLGVTWNPYGTGVTAMTTYDLQGVESVLLLGTLDGVFFSLNDGSTWAPLNTGLTSVNSRSFAVRGTDVFLGTGNGVFQLDDGETSWSDISEGLFAPFILSLAVNGTYLYAATEQGVWQRPLAEVVTSIATTDTHVATTFALHAAFPNPFNPSTVVTFSLPRSMVVSLTVYDVLGKEVSRLADGLLEAGRHERTWNAEHVAGGTYLCRMDAGGNVMVRRLVLVK